MSATELGGFHHMKRLKNYGSALLIGSVLALAGCAGSDGSQGPGGATGADGGTGGNGMNGVAGKLKLTINGVVTAPVNGTNTATLTFTITPASAVCPGSVCNDTLSVLGQKTLYAQEYNTTTKSFDTNKNFSFGSIHFKSLTADGNGAVYTAIKANPSFTVETSASAFVYGYIADTLVMPANGNYKLYNGMSSATKVYGAVGYSSNAVVSGCEKCHGAPYSKHGYRQATVAGLPDFAACKACHTDQRGGSDWSWYAIADDPAQLAADPTGLASVMVNGVLSPWKARYNYTANVMNDTHNSHAFEFNYPQSMANCVTCHKGKLANILTDANFKPAVCKSCHPITAVAGIEGGRAPALLGLFSGSTTHDTVGDMYAGAGSADTACNGCHFAGNTVSAPTFAQLHKGYDELIYKDGNGTRFDASIVATVTGVSYDAPSYIGTVSFTIQGVSSTAVGVSSRAYAGLYGFGAKDFLASNVSLTVTQQADKSQFIAKLDLSGAANKPLVDAGQVKRVEIAIMPTVLMDPSSPASTTNPAVIVTGALRTIDITQTSADARITDDKVYGKKIVDPAKCLKCHDALAVTFHATENYRGTVGVVGCRLCHTAKTAGSHLEMQSRSIDSYVHGIHAMQMIDAKNFPYGSYDPAVDPVSAVSVSRYNDHVEGNYPNFAGPLNCESCHYAGTYDVPDQTKSLPGVLSAMTPAATRTGLTYPYPSMAVGPAARACGACHRAFAINESDGSKLGAFVGHTTDFSSYVDPTQFTTLAAAVQYAIGGSTTSYAMPAGAKVERCDECHATAGSDHQALFNTWRNGTK
jgi:OmcA/MtrC family decaheme c-type cytochrome